MSRSSRIAQHAVCPAPALSCVHPAASRHQGPAPSAAQGHEGCLVPEPLGAGALWQPVGLGSLLRNAQCCAGVQPSEGTSVNPELSILLSHSSQGQGEDPVSLPPSALIPVQAAGTRGS